MSFSCEMYPEPIFDHLDCISFYRLVVEMMFRHSLHTLRSTPQTVFSAFKHTGNTKHASKIALTTRSVNDAYGKPSTGSLSGKIGATSIASKSTLLIYHIFHHLFLILTV